MIPEQGQYVKIIFKNSTQVEGLVEEWSNTRVTLKSEDGKSALIIMNISEDALAIKIMLDNTPAKKKLEDLEEQFQEVYERPSSDDLRVKDLAKLRAAMIEQEKKIVSEKLRDHAPTSVSGVKYGNPFITKQSTK